MASADNRSWSALSRKRYSFADGALHVTEEAAPIRFSLPFEVQDAYALPPNKLRLLGTAFHRLPDGETMLATAIVSRRSDACIPEKRGNVWCRASVVAFTSQDGGKTYEYLATIAPASQNTSFYEGPNEHDVAIVTTAAGPLLVCAIRVDGGDCGEGSGCPAAELYKP